MPRGRQTYRPPGQDVSDPVVNPENVNPLSCYSEPARVDLGQAEP
jgi:hypothetical protein